MITTYRRSLWAIKRFAYVMILTIGVLPCMAQEKTFDSLLRQVVISAGQAKYGFVLIGPDLGRYPPGARFRPIKGLGTKAAVPFLVHVLKNGPDWTEEQMLTEQGGMYPHIARCYAALCLGAVGDVNALTPLIETLRHGDYLEHKYTITSSEKQAHDIREYAAIALGLLGDDMAVDPLLERLPISRNVNVASSLARLGDIKAIPLLIEQGFQLDPNAHEHIHRCLEELTKTRAKLQYDRKSRSFTDPIFPELGRLNKTEAYHRHWRHWQANGRKYTKEQFNQYYTQWKRSLTETPKAFDVHASLRRKMLAGGVAVMPELMNKLETDGEDVLSAIEQLVGRRITKSNRPITRSQTMDWWNQNRQKWSDQHMMDP